MVVPVFPHSRHTNTRLCLAQKTHGGRQSDVWAVDSVRVMPVKPANSDFHVQFSLHLTCGLNARTGSNNRFAAAASLCVSVCVLSYVTGYRPNISLLLRYRTVRNFALFRIDCTCKTNKNHFKNVGPIRHCEPPHAHSPDVASGTVARRLRIDVHDNDDNDNA